MYSAQCDDTGVLYVTWVLALRHHDYRYLNHFYHLFRAIRDILGDGSAGDEKDGGVDVWTILETQLRIFGGGFYQLHSHFTQK